MQTTAFLTGSDPSSERACKAISRLNASRYDTLQEAQKYHQFRVLDIIDEEGNVLLQLEHEVCSRLAGMTWRGVASLLTHAYITQTRSMFHPSYMRPLVNRMGSVGIYCTQ